MCDQIFDYIIIGAGITGVTLGRLLQSHNKDNFVILEAEPYPGGLCRTENIDGHILDIGGGHFLCSKYPKVYAFIFAHVPKDEFSQFNRVSKIKLGLNDIDYPIESNIWQMPLDEQISYINSVINAGEAKGTKAPENYDEWIRWKLGDKIANEYMLPYNYKLWGVPAIEMDIDWLQKIPRINQQEIIRSCLEKNSLKHKMPSHSKFYYPKAGGFQRIFDAIYQTVKEKVVLNCKVKKLQRQEKYWVVNNQFKAREVINTAPWPGLFDALGSPQNLRDDFNKLKANELTISLHEYEYNHNWHWRYIPNIDTLHHREFFIANFAPHSAKNGVYFETNTNRLNSNYQKWEKPPIFQYNNTFAYPIPIKGHAKAIQNIMQYYSEKELFGVGRWGQWQYFNADVCILEAMNFIDKLCVDGGMQS